MATFFNQATLSYNGQTTSSNITTGELLEVLTAQKTAISASYGPGDSIVYAISIHNEGTVNRSGITITDDLGAYTQAGETVIPLDYVSGSLRAYINGEPDTTPTVTAGPPLVISGIDIPAGGNALVLYETTANGFAPVGEGASITNTAEISGCAEPITATATIEAESDIALTIAKAICPSVIGGCGGEVTYTLIIQNSGSRAVISTDNVVVSDTFEPALSDISVEFNGESWTEGMQYSYDAATGVFTTSESSVTVPAATFTQGPNGTISVTPGVAIITVSGRL